MTKGGGQLAGAHCRMGGAESTGESGHPPERLSVLGKFARAIVAAQFPGEKPLQPGVQVGKIDRAHTNEEVLGPAPESGKIPDEEMDDYDDEEDDYEGLDGVDAAFAGQYGDYYDDEGDYGSD
jgi:hypothetical protein